MAKTADTVSKRCGSSLLVEKDKQASEGFSSRCGQLGIRTESVKRYLHAVDSTRRKRIGGTHRFSDFADLTGKQARMSDQRGFFWLGSRDSERSRERTTKISGRPFDRSLSLRNGRINELRYLLPVLYFDAYIDWNTSDLTDETIVGMIDEFAEMAAMARREVREFSSWKASVGGRRKEYLRSKRNQLQRIKDKMEAAEKSRPSNEIEWREAINEFQRVFFDDVLDYEFTTLRKYGHVHAVGSADTAADILKLLDELISDLTSRGPRKLVERERVLTILVSHFCKLTGEDKLSWSGDSRYCENCSGTRFVNHMLKLIGCPPQTDFRNRRTQSTR